MPYLAINNYAVSCRDASTGFKEAGMRGYNQANRYFLNRAGRDKREWKFETIPLSNDDAQSLIGMLQMRGEHFPYAAVNSTNVDAAIRESSATTVPFYSQKGRVHTGTPAAAVQSNRGADGSLVYTRDSVLMSPYDDYRQGVYQGNFARTNVLTASNANPELAANLSAINGATLADGAPHAWTGTGSVQVTSNGVNGGIQSDQSAHATGLYVASAYVNGASGGEDLNIIIQDNAIVRTVAPYNFILPASSDAWMRIWTFATTVTTTNVNMQVTAAAGSPIFYIDGMQLELVVAPQTFPSPWLAGTTSRAASALTYPSAFFREYTDGFTINFWAQRPIGGVQSFIIDSNIIDIWALAADNTVVAQLLSNTTEGTAVAFSVNSTSTITTGWRMFTLTFEGRYDPADVTAQRFRIYVNGVLEATDTTNATDRRWTMEDLFTSTGNLEIGGRNTVDYGISISNLSFLPYPASVATILGWYGTPAATDPPLSFFPLTCSGDFLGSNERWISAFGEVTDVENIQVFDGGVWNTNYKKIKFTLTEV